MGDEKNLTPDPSAGGEKAGGLEGNGGNPFAEAALPRFDEAVVDAGTTVPASDFLAKGGEGAFDEPIIDFTKPAAPTPPEGLDVIRAQTEKNAAKAAGREGFIPGLSSQDEQRIGEANDIRKTEFDRRWDAREKDWSVKDAEHTARETLAAQRAEGSSDSTVAAETTSTPSEDAPAASTASEISAHDAYNARVDALPQERQDELSAAVIEYDRNGVLPDDPELRDLVAEGATLGPPPSEDPSLTSERPSVDEPIVETPDAPMAPAAEAPLEETAGEEPAAAVSEATAIAEPEVPDAGIEVPAKANEVEEGSILIRKSDGKEFKVTGIEKYKDGNGASINYSSTDGSESGGGDANAMFTVGEWSRRIDAPAAAAGDGPGDPPDRPVAESAGSAGDEEQPIERDPFARAKAQRESGAGTTPISTEGAAATGSAEGVDSGAAATGSAEGVDSGAAATGSAEGVDSGAAAAAEAPHIPGAALEDRPLQDADGQWYTNFGETPITAEQAAQLNEERRARLAGETPVESPETGTPEAENSLANETAEEKLARLTNTSIVIEEFDADVAKLSEDQKLQLGEAVINFDQRNELPEDEALRELVIRGAGLHEARNELDAYSAQSPEAKAALGESVTNKKAEKATAVTPESETPPTTETPDDNTRIMNEIKAEIKAGNLSRRDELARREDRIKDEEEFAKLDATDAKDMTGKDLDRYNELKEKLNSDPTAPELTKEQLEAMQLKFLEDFISGKAFTEGENGESILTPEAEAALEKINKHQLEQSLQTDHGLSAKDAKEQAKNILDKTSRGERKKLAIEKRVQQKLQELMAMEMQAMGIPQRLENYRKAKTELRTQIEKKEAEIGGLNPGEVKTAKARSELYNMQSRYATIKAEIARSKNIGRQLNAQYKEKMQSVKRDLRLSGRFASLVAWANSRMTDAYTNIAMNIDSIHDSE